MGGRVALLLGSLVASLLGLELAVRALGIAPEVAPIEINTLHGRFVTAEDPRLVYVPKPGGPGVNREGLRDRERSLARRPAGGRIVVLGDSVAFGLCSASIGLLPLEQIFPRRLDRALAPAGWEVVNLAVSGYGTEQEILFLQLLSQERGLPLAPDVVLLAYVLNDHLERTAEGRQLARHPDYAAREGLRRALRRNVLLRSALARTVWYRLGGLDAIAAAPTPARSLAHGEQVAADLEPLRALSEQMGFRVVVAIFPWLSPSGEAFHGAEGHAAVAAVARSKGFSVLDLRPGFLAASGGDLARLRGRCTAMHPDERGHELASALILEHLRAELGLEASASLR